jgi:hypothetical protein
LVACFGVSEDALHAEAEQRETGGVLVLFADDDEARIRVAFENIREQCAGGLTGGVRVDHVDLGLRRFKGTKIGSERGLELFGDDFEVGFEQ